MKITVNKEKNTVTIGDIELHIFDTDLNSIRTDTSNQMRDRFLEEINNKCSEIFVYAKDLASCLRPEDLEKIQPVASQVRKAVREAYNRGARTGNLGEIELAGAKFQIYYDMSRVAHASMKHVMGCMFYYVADKVYVFGPVGYIEVVTANHKGILETVEGLI